MKNTFSFFVLVLVLTLTLTLTLTIVLGTGCRSHMDVERRTSVPTMVVGTNVHYSTTTYSDHSRVVGRPGGYGGGGSLFRFNATIGGVEYVPGGPGSYGYGGGGGYYGGGSTIPPHGNRYGYGR